VDKAALRIGAVAFIHRFGSSLNTHVHFHVCVVDGVFEAVTADDTVQPPTLEGVHFHAPSGLDDATVAQVHAAVRRRLLHAFVVRGHIEQWDAKEMLAYKHSGFSVDASVRIEADDRTGLERLLRYCARPSFSKERLRKEGCALVCSCAKQHSEPVGGKQSDLALTPMELIDRIAALVPPPRTHRQRHHGVPAPNSPLREQVTAMAQMLPAPLQAQAHDPTSPEPGAATGAVGIGGAAKQPVTQPPMHSPAHYLWAALIARIYEVFPLICPICAGQMRIIAFITDGAEVRKILEHIGADSQAPRITPARGPPLWDECDAPLDEGVQALPDWDLAAQPAPDYQVDQRVSW